MGELQKNAGPVTIHAQNGAYVNVVITETHNHSWPEWLTADMIIELAGKIQKEKGLAGKTSKRTITQA